MAEPDQRRGGVINSLEESVIALMFAAMTLVTFSQVVARYVFNSGAVWALEATTYLFGWLVLFGISYGVKRSAHLGVDAFVKLFPTKAQRAFALLAVAAALVYGILMLIGSWGYFSRLYAVGIMATDLPVARWILVAILPLGFILLIIRLLQVGWAVLQGRQESLLADEAQDAIKELRQDSGQSAGR